MSLTNIRIVMVNTTDTGNIGSAARAMKNMGLEKLYLVDPKHQPDEKAYRRAGHAIDIMDTIVYCQTLEQALAGCGLAIATSARERKIAWPLLDARTACENAVIEAAQHPVAIVFGREDRGLTNEELHKCHWHLNIPTSEQYSALNIAQAIQVVCYELLMAAKKPVPEPDAGEVLADVPALESFYAYWEKLLQQSAYLDANESGQTMARVRRVFTRTRLEALELNMLRGMLRAMVEKTAAK